MMGGDILSNKRKRTQKGFTLLELIIVMVLFSIIMLAVIRVLNPASKIMTNTAVSENTYANTDNIGQYVKSSIQYADALWVMTGDHVTGGDAKYVSLKKGADVTLSGIDEIVKEYVNENYSEIVTYDHGGTLDTKPIEGKVYVMRLLNNADGTFAQGQITLRTYDFNTAGSVTLTGGTEVEQLSKAYFEGSNSVYDYNYVIGAHQFADGAISDTGGTYRVIEADKKGEDFAPIGNQDLAVSIILDKHNKNESVGYIDVIDDKGTNTCREFRTPCSISVANIPLINIGFNHNMVPSRFCIYENKTKDPANPFDTVGKWGDDKGVSITAFHSNETSTEFMSNQVDFSNDIYFIYSYANELH